MTADQAAPTPAELPWALEALLFASGEPVSLSALAAACGVRESAARRALEHLGTDCRMRGLRLIEDGAGLFELAYAPEYAPYVERLFGASPGQKLSRAALETLAIIAYRQPCSRGDVEAIRGVNSDRMMATLEARGLIEFAGNAGTPGRPRLYRTTLRFFEHFGLGGPADMPPLPDDESPEEVTV